MRVWNWLCRIFRRQTREQKFSSLHELAKQTSVTVANEAANRKQAQEENERIIEERIAPILQAVEDFNKSGLRINEAKLKLKRVQSRAIADLSFQVEIVPPDEEFLRISLLTQYWHRQIEIRPIYRHHVLCGDGVGSHDCYSIDGVGNSYCFYNPEEAAEFLSKLLACYAGGARRFSKIQEMLNISSASKHNLADNEKRYERERARSVAS